MVYTKYEFGRLNGELILIDEIHTPDSSRFFYADGYDKYAAGDKSEPPKQLSKEFVREWLIENGFRGDPGQEVPELTDEFINSISERYMELYEKMSGQKFNKVPSDDTLERIETNVTDYLTKAAK